MDIEGNETKTEINNDIFKGDEDIRTFLDGEGILDIYISREEKNKIPVVHIKFNPESKTSKLMDFRSIEGITGLVTLIGLRGNETYFASYVVDKNILKGGITTNVFAVNADGVVRTIRELDFPFTAEHFRLGKVIRVFPFDQQWKDDLYFAIDIFATTASKTIKKIERIVNYVYKIDEGDNFSNVIISQTYDYNAAADPMYFIKQEEETALIITRGIAKGIYFSDFKSVETLESGSRGLYDDEYNGLLEMGYEQHAAAFKICSGMARLVTITNKGVGTLYTQKEVK